MNAVFEGCVLCGAPAGCTVPIRAAVEAAAMNTSRLAATTRSAPPTTSGRTTCAPASRPGLAIMVSQKLAVTGLLAKSRFSLSLLDNFSNRFLSACPRACNTLRNWDVMTAGNLYSSTLQGRDVRKHTDAAGLLLLHCDAFLIDRLVTSLGLFAEAQNLVLHLISALAHTDVAQVQKSPSEASA